MIFRTKMIASAAIGYIIAVITSPMVPELVSLVLPVIGAAVGSFIPSKKKRSWISLLLLRLMLRLSQQQLLHLLKRGSLLIPVQAILLLRLIRTR